MPKKNKNSTKIWNKYSIGILAINKLTLIKYKIRNMKYKIRNTLSKFAKKRLLVSICLAVVVSIIFFIAFNNLSLEILINNARYFLSAAAQCIAALAALVLVIYNINLSEIPSYEVIFGNKIYQKILEKYREVKKVRMLIISSVGIILFLLISTMLIQDNFKMLVCLLIINLFFLTSLLVYFMFFVLDSIINSGKSKFFDTCNYMIRNELNYDELFDVFKRSTEFLEKTIHIHAEVYEEIRLDVDNIKELLRESIIYAYGNLLQNKNVMGSNIYYDNFRNILDYFIKKENANLAWSPAYFEISPNFKKHIQMCVADGHCQKYIPDAIEIIIKIINIFNRRQIGPSVEYYLHVFAEIGNYLTDLNKSNLKSYVESGLNELAEEFGTGGFFNYDFFLNTLNELKLSNKDKFKYFGVFVSAFDSMYGKVQNDKELEGVLNYNNINRGLEFRDLKSLGEKIKSELEMLKSSQDYNSE